MESREAKIIVNGIELTKAQSSCIRVAVASFLMELADPVHMKALGPIGPLYQKHLSDVQKIIFLNLR